MNHNSRRYVHGCLYILGLAVTASCLYMLSVYALGAFAGLHLMWRSLQYIRGKEQATK